MDHDRQIRMVIPPFFFLGSLLWGALLANPDLAILNPEDVKELFGVLAATAVAILPIGFLISSISVILLYGIARIGKEETYEAVISDAVLPQIWRKCGRTEPAEKKLAFYAVVTFDHEILNDGIHSWIRRRWNHFNIAAHSIVALLLSHVIAFLLSYGVESAFKIPQSWPWWITTLVLVAVFSFTGRCAWLQTMEMIEFQAERAKEDSQITTDGTV